MANIYRCPKCRTELLRRHNYCYKCGGKINWGNIPEDETCKKEVKQPSIEINNEIVIKEGENRIQAYQRQRNEEAMRNPVYRKLRRRCIIFSSISFGLAVLMFLFPLFPCFSVNGVNHTGYEGIKLLIDAFGSTSSELKMTVIVAVAPTVIFICFSLSLFITNLVMFITSFTFKNIQQEFVATKGKTISGMVWLSVLAGIFLIFSAALMFLPSFSSLEKKPLVGYILMLIMYVAAVAVTDVTMGFSQARNNFNPYKNKEAK